ncbi:MAG: hypothetical protein ACJ749_17940 [Flavisolibacter sp.]|jgi:hypothetical protein
MSYQQEYIQKLQTTLMEIERHIIKKKDFKDIKKQLPAEKIEMIDGKCFKDAIADTSILVMHIVETL